MPIDPVSAGLQVGATAAMTISQISDMNKRRKFEQALDLLSNDQQNALNQQLAAAGTQTDRLKILSDSLTNFLIQNQTSGARNNVILYAVAAVLSLGILITVVILNKKQ